MIQGKRLQDEIFSLAIALTFRGIYRGGLLGAAKCEIQRVILQLHTEIYKRASSRETSCIYLSDLPSGRL
jgi:hypothetical protein